jgi:hypothetical protein
MKAKGPPALDALEEPTEDLLQDLTLAEPPSDEAREEDVVEEEQYVKVRCPSKRRPACNGKKGMASRGGGGAMCGGARACLRYHDVF